MQQVDDILDVGVEVDPWAGKVHALAEPGKGRGVDFVTGGPQVRRHPPPAPAAHDRALNQDKHRHTALLDLSPPISQARPMATPCTKLSDAEHQSPAFSRQPSVVSSLQLPAF